MPRRVLVTGGAGFIGHHLVRALLDRGDDVVVLDSYLTGLRERLDNVADQIDIVEGDIRHPPTVASSMAGADTVFHLAALPSVPRSIADPVMTTEINVQGTVTVMQAAAESGVRRVVLAGSSSIYGSTPELPRRENQRPDPQSPYAVSKLAAEGYALTIGATRNVESVVLRYFNVFGPGQDPESQYAAVVPKFVTAAIAGRKPAVYGDGRQSRDFTFVDNVVRANLLAADEPRAAGQVFNVGCGASYSLLQLLDQIGHTLGIEMEPEFGPPLVGDVRDSLADITRARDILGYVPAVDFAQGVERTVSAYLQSSRS